MKKPDLPTSWEFYLQLMQKLIETHGPLSRAQMSEFADDMLSKDYEWNKMKTIAGKTNYKTPYYRFHAALTKLGDLDWEYNNVKYEKIEKGNQVTYGFANGIQKVTSKQMSLGDNLEVKELPPELVQATKKKSKTKGKFDNNKHVETKNYSRISTLLEAGHHIMLVGEPGIGKTYEAEVWAYKNNWNVFKVVLTRDSAEWQLIGRSNLILTYAEIRSYALDHNKRCVQECELEGKPCPAIRDSAIEIMRDTWVDGEFIQAARNAEKGRPTLLLVDEINFGDQSTTAGNINSLGEISNPSVTIKDTGEKIFPNTSKWRMVATMNPGTMGTHKLNEALESRFTVIRCEMPDNWKEIVKSQAGKEPSWILENIFLKIRGSQAVKKTIALREAVKWTQLEKIFGEAETNKDVQEIIVMQFEYNDALMVREVIEAVIKNPPKKQTQGN